MDLRTTYMGLELSSPIVVSASHCQKIFSILLKWKTAVQAPWFCSHCLKNRSGRRHVKYASVMTSTSDMFAEASGFFPNLDDYATGAEEYLEKISEAKRRVDIPIIASLNGITTEGWIEYSRQIEQAGADGLEVNIFFIPGDIHVSSSEVEHRYLNIITEVRNTVKIPVAVKLNPYFSSMGNMALRHAKSRCRCTGFIQPFLPARF